MGTPLPFGVFERRSGVEGRDLNVMFQCMPVEKEHQEHRLTPAKGSLLILFSHLEYVTIVWCWWLTHTMTF